MGTVYRADDLVENQPVAVKVLRATIATDAQRFEREAALISELTHPAIVRYVASGRTISGNLYLVTDWIDGQTLTDLLYSRGLSIAESIGVVARIASAVGYAHQRRIVHRDIKPANIMFRQGAVGRATLIDFGIALLTEDAIRFTEAGTILGTPSYMAPEQARAMPAIDSRADVFALGCVLYECITGEMAFGGSNPLAVQAKVVMFDPVDPRQIRPDIPEAVARLVMRMLAKRVVERPASGAELATELAAVFPTAEAASTDLLRREVKEMATVSIPTVPGHGDPQSTTPNPPIACIITGALPVDYARPKEVAPSRWRDLLRALVPIADRFAGRVELLGTGGFIVALRGTDGAPLVAERAAHCALAIKHEMPKLCLVLSIADDRSIETAIDRGAHTMELSVRRAILSGGLDGGSRSAGVWVDARAVELLAASFDIEIEQGASQASLLTNPKSPPQPLRR